MQISVSKACWGEYFSNPHGFKTGLTEFVKDGFWFSVGRVSCGLRESGREEHEFRWGRQEELPQ